MIELNILSDLTLKKINLMIMIDSV